MKNDKVKKWLCLVLIFGGFFILRNFIPSGLDQAGWDGFLVLFVAVLLWLTEAVPMAVTAVFVLFFGAWVGFEKEANILANFASTARSFCWRRWSSARSLPRLALAAEFHFTFCRCSGTKPRRCCWQS